MEISSKSMEKRINVGLERILKWRRFVLGIYFKMSILEYLYRKYMERYSWLTPNSKTPRL